MWNLGEKKPCHTRDSNPHQYYASRTLNNRATSVPSGDIIVMFLSFHKRNSIIVKTTFGKIDESSNRVDCQT